MSVPETYTVVPGIEDPHLPEFKMEEKKERQRLKKSESAEHKKMGMELTKGSTCTDKRWLAKHIELH